MGTDATPKPNLATKLSLPRSQVFQVVKELASDLETAFKEPSRKYYGDRFIRACAEIRDHIQHIEPQVYEIQKMAPRYDFDEKTPGNGYRSLVCVVDTLLVRLLKLMRRVWAEKDGYLFRSAFCGKELANYADVLRFLRQAFSLMEPYTDLWPTNSLFPTPETMATFKALIESIEELDPACFYGRAIGFQFCNSVARVFGVIGVALAAYSMSWERGSGPIGTLLSSSRFLISPELRARRIIDVVKHADVSFCKGFWNLAEGQLLTRSTEWLCPGLAVAAEVRIPAGQPLYLRRRPDAEAADGVAFAQINPPSSHTGPRPIGARLLSYRRRPGLQRLLGDKKKPMEEAPLSPSLLFHCHGGGFVANSPRSHEIYLRHWAKVLDCPILSVDYSLAPENPFPRALEDILYAYVWAINHSASLGWTGERICFVGDSAGGNLLTAITLHLIEMGVEKLPSGLVMAYAAFVFKYAPSPSRLLCVMDPLLPMGIILRCLAAYTGNCHLIEGREESKASSPTEKRTLTDYLDKVKRSSVDGVDGDQRIMSLINLVSQSREKVGEELAGKEDAKEGTASRVKVHLPEDSDEDGAEEEKEDKIGKAAAKLVRFSAKGKSMEESRGVAERDRRWRRRRWQSEGGEAEDDWDLQLPRSISCGSLTETDPAFRLSEELQPDPEPLVEIQADPSRICLTTSGHEEDGIVAYLAKHRLTKDSLVLSSSVLSPDGGPSSAQLCPPAKMPLAPSPSVRSLGFEEEELLKPSLGVGEQRQRSLTHTLTTTVSSSVSLATGHAMDQLSGWLETSETLEQVGTLEKKAREEQSEPPIVRLRALKSPDTHLISPLAAPPEILARLPPLYILAGQLDPLLDDSIAFATKARAAGAVEVKVELLDGLPHGFLNFTLPSPECRQGARRVLRRIRGVLFPESVTSNTNATDPTSTLPSSSNTFTPNVR